MTSLARTVRTVPLFLLALAAPAAAQDEGTAVAEAELGITYTLPPAVVQDMFSRDPSFAVLDAPGPGKRFFLVPTSTELSTLELLSKPTLRLAELEIRPATNRLWHLDTYGITGLRIYDLEADAFRTVTVPEGTFLSDLVWSPDGARVAFLAHLPAGTEVWTAPAEGGRARRLADTRILATLGTSAQTSVERSRMLQWTPEGSVLTLAIPQNRGPEPADEPVPPGPVFRSTRPEPTAVRTFPNLLRDAHDADLFEYYTTSQIVELGRGGPRTIGAPRMYESIALSADGQHILATYIERPFSLITSHQGFPRVTVVMDRAGQVLATLDRRPLREGGGRGGNGSDAGRRAWAWRPDGAGLSFLQRVTGEDARGDRVMLLPPPFDSAGAVVVASSDDGIRSVVYTADGRRAFATVNRTGRTGIVDWDLTQAEPERRVLVPFVDGDSIFSQPGELWTERTPNGIEHVLVTDAADAVYLRGEGLKPDYRPQPFVDRVSLADTTKTRVFEGTKESWERPLVALDPALSRMIVSRESKTDFPDSFLWTGSATMADLTENVDPFPETTAARRVDFSFRRRDGLEVQGRISLPTDYRDGEKVPAIFWTYPREFTTSGAYTRSTYGARNHNAFTHVTWLRWSDIWLTQGYALVYPDIPIIGEDYNDTYISNMVDAMYGAMRAVDGLGFVDMDRIGHGGHSYGAFATANLLAHTPFFKAGIAGDGAYNRSLTPTGFQAEPRNIWKAPDTYFEMSPFFKADQINTPLLMYHGGDDNNTGTWPIQSERFMHALTSLGKEAVLYVYPYESHTPRAIENNLDMWARWLGWFDEHVKNGGQPARATTDSGGH